MKKLYCAAIIATLILIGCSEPIGPDQCLRRELFQQCLHNLPAGPQSTQYNDWNEIVSECESAAFRQSLKRNSQIAPTCAL